MKRLVSILMICLLMLGLLPTVAVSAADDLSVSASSTTVTVGQNVILTLKYDGNNQTIGGIKGNITYDTNVFSYVSFSGTDVQVNGGAGKIIFIVTPSGVTGPTSATITLTFTADAPGNSTFKVTTEEFINDTDYSEIGTPTKELSITANNPTLSGNADLKSLKPSKGTLTPKFDPDVTEYKIAVGYDVSSLSLSATTAHSDAKISISGKNALSVGKNTRTVTVTAPNGTTKKYTVVITRAAAPSTTTGTNPPTGTTTLPPPEDALDVTVNGQLMTILDTQAAVDLPKGFSWSNLTINRVEVPAAVHAEAGLTLLYLVSDDKTDDGFYLYDATADSFARYRPLQPDAALYLLFDLPTDGELKGMVRSTLDYEGQQVAVYVHNDAALTDFCVVWASPMGGEPAWYTYDKKEGTLQRYHTSAGAGDTVTLPDATKNDKPVSGSPDKSQTDDGSFFEKHKQIFAVIGIAVAGIAVIALLFLLIVSAGSHRKGKH